MIRERANPKPLHNFALPRLQWGNRKQARCMKVVDHSTWSLPSSSISAVQRRAEVLPSFVQTRLAAAFPAEEEEEEDGDGIEAVREKLMLDLKAETDRIKEELLKGSDVEEEEEEVAAVSVAVAAEVGRKLMDGAAATKGHKEDQATETRPWRLRTRKTSWKAPPAASSSAATLDSPAGKESIPMTRDSKGPPEKRKQRAKFAVALRKKEIEEDFMKLTGHRPPRRPKKRRCTVQKRLEVLFPGQWLTEVKADTYKVVEVPSKTARRTDRST
ncbi:hypothetical protein MLD38_017504 [Melastoma candidum]|uniref:Uncharacterized protein n=1 Tax=Melastoma candidum TaxID=119954 RepID=A0ACB9QQV4_9MYRT|nr:hypothetical protein MLD38_017504 [Melastoma candidum]